MRSYHWDYNTALYVSQRLDGPQPKIMANLNSRSESNNERVYVNEYEPEMKKIIPHKAFTQSLRSH